MAEFRDLFVAEILNDKFWCEYYEKEPHLFTSSDFPHGLEMISKLVNVDEYVNMILQAGPRVKYFKNNLPVNANIPPHIAYLEGCSLIMNRSDRLSRNIYELCKALRRELHHVFAVTYLTPANSSTVPIHNDDQDTFLWQIWGEKEWTVYGPSPCALIYSNEMLGKGDDGVPEIIPPQRRPPVVFTKTIKAGELLYLPRGFLHSATTSSKPSLHVTLTTASSDYSLGASMERLIREALQPDGNRLIERSQVSEGPVLSKEENEAFRHAVPSGDQENFNAEALKERRLILGRGLEKIKTLLTVENAEKMFLTHIDGVNVMQDEYMASNAAQRRISSQVKSTSTVKLARGMKGEVGKDNSSVTFHAKGKGTLQMPIDPDVAGIVRKICKGEECKVSSLDLTGDMLKTLCVLFVFVEKGILEVVA